MIAKWPLSHAKALGLDGQEEALWLRLLTAREMSHLFDGAELIRERFCGLTKSLVAHTLTR